MTETQLLRGGKKRKDANKQEQSKSLDKVRMRPPRSDVIRIKVISKDGYGDIIKEIKSAEELSILKERVTYMRRTISGELLLELGKPGVETIELQKATESRILIQAAGI